MDRVFTALDALLYPFVISSQSRK